MKKTAVILLNMGGPSSIAGVRKFLFNLFYDPAIIGIPNPMRWFLAHYISIKRTNKAKGIYNLIGGKSPILEETKKQADALEKLLGDESLCECFRVFISMRYSTPFSYETIKEVEEYSPDEIVLLPLYPQFSKSTSGSSIEDFKNKVTDIPIKTVLSYEGNEKFISAHTELLKMYYDRAKKYGKPKVLFSAHGIPQKFIDDGDPYIKHVEKTCKLISERLDLKDYVICYQSRVGKQKWVEPYTKDEIIKTSKEKIPLIIVPISFVSEHSETLVELDITYKKLAEENGCEHYYRVPALGINELFIKSLTEIALV